MWLWSGRSARSFAMPMLSAGAQERWSAALAGATASFTRPAPVPGTAHVEVISARSGASEVDVTFTPSDGDPTPQVVH